MNVQPPNVKTVFDRALEIEAPEERKAYLDRIGTESPEVRARVEDLLRAYDNAGSFLQPAALEQAGTLEEPPRERPGTVIGPYKLLQAIGEGGMGTVFMAEQTQPVQRKVALKVIKPGMNSRQVIVRFEAERQALALMDHPNIAKVLDAGTTDSGRPYFVMELVKGVPITKYCDDRRLTPHARLELFLPVCLAVQHAHQKGIIHRDLKPSNVLIALYDDRPVPKVIDFGIAKATGQQLTDGTLFTEFGQVVGTLEYMSPEQAGLNQLDIDTRSDIYSLGVLLYELLTGTTPLERKRVRAGVMLEVLRLIREEEPPKPSTRLSTAEAIPSVAANRGLEPKKLSGLMRGELDWVVMKCLEKDRNRRYETASAFAADVQRYLHDEPVAACPPSAWYRFRKLARRHKAGLTAATLISLALVAGTAISLWQAVRATEAATSERQALVNLVEEQKATKRELGHTQAAEKKATLELFESLVAQARANRLSRRIGQRFGTFEILKRARALARQLQLPAERFLEMRNEALAAMALTDLRVAKDWTDTSESALDFDPGLQRYACADFKGTVYVRRVGNGAEICRVPAPGPGEVGLLFSPDGCLLAVTHAGLARVQVWKLAGNETSEVSKTSEVLPGKKPAKILDKAWRWDFSFSPDSRQVAFTLPDLSMGIFELATAKSVQRLAPVGGTGRPVFNPKGRQLALFTRSAAQVHDLQTGKVLWKQPLSGSAAHLEWHPDGKTLAVGESMSGGEVITLWDVATRKQIAKLEGSHGGGIVYAFNHAGTLLASSGWNNILRLWDPLANRQLFSTHTWIITPRFSPDDRFLAAKEPENKLRIWEIAAGGEYRTVTAKVMAGNRPYASSAISPDGRLLAGAGGGSGLGVGLWEFPSGKPLAFFEDNSHNFVLWEASGALLIMGQSGLFRRPIRRDRETGVVHIGTPEKLPLPGTPVAIAQSRDGRVLASAQLSGAVVLHADQPDRLIRLGPHTDARFVAVSPDGQWVATGGYGHPGGAKVWDARTGELVKDLSVVGTFCRVVFSPDGKCLLTSAGVTPQIRAWQVGNWVELPFKERVKGANPAFSPDGKLLVVETGTGAARLLDPKTGRECARLEDPSQDRANEFSFSPDSTKLVCATGDGHCLHVWDLRAMRRQLADMGLDWESPP